MSGAAQGGNDPHPSNKQGVGQIGVENRRSRRTFQRLRSYVFLYLFDVISRHTYFTLRALALLSFFRRTEE